MQHSKAIELGGRRFRVMSVMTIRRNLSIQKHLRAAGLIDRLGAGENETAEQWARRVLNRLVDSGQLCLMLAHHLIPEDLPDVKWTEQTAQETAAFVEELAAGEGAGVYTLVVDLLVFFYAAGRHSAEPSGIASTEAAGEAHATPASAC